MLAIIGGSGLSELSNLDVQHRQVVRTPYGDPSGPLLFGHVGSQQTVFLARHGYGHTIPPHMVNYRANIWALKQAGAEAIVSVASVGGIRADLAPGVLAIPDQIVDYTWGRKNTFFEGGDTPVRHIDFTTPYDQPLRARLLTAAAEAGLLVKDGAVYGATQGPRLETAAEINRYESDGVHMVGMTGMPEAVLARELDMPYAAIAVVANWAAGRGDSAQGVAIDKFGAVLNVAMGQVRQILQHLAEAE
ncbi:S-methyl-5'-thioinosine phosphorylase [Uliginosibacterium sp. H1]|uniref:S-methyl-5'-thioinosine phosphorylase n=1 Tax=Uliginosibacterium sp. H1 TaxID=3114757 RepID=UPI002E18BEC7|nr:S-methyl-5'-thioinosine phosphorylase [Uliginosibacterium sp. H1]